MSRQRKASRSQRKPAPRETRKPAGYTTKTGDFYPYKSPAATVTVCTHWRQGVRLDAGLKVYASAWRDKPKILDDTPSIDLGFYLDSLWSDGGVLATPGFGPPARVNVKPRVIYPWADFSVPLESVRVFCETLAWLLSEIQEGKRVDVGCFGAHGRTGTLLACLLVAQGTTATSAIARIRSTYCTEAIETREQLRFVRMVDSVLNGAPMPPSEPPPLKTLPAWPDEEEDDAPWTLSDAMKYNSMWADDDAYGWSPVLDCVDGPGYCIDASSCHKSCLRDALERGATSP